MHIIAVCALKNAILPTLAMTGLHFGWMLGGTMLVEGVFDFPGIGLVLVALFLFVSAFGPMLAPYPEDFYGAVDFGAKLLPPSAGHWFGTAQVGSDIFNRVLIGARTTLQIGLIAGMTGGWISEAIMRISDVFPSIPGQILAIVGALGPGVLNAMIALGLVRWPGYVRLAQAKTLSHCNGTNVDAARVLGAGPPRVVFVHVPPNCPSPIIVKASMDMGMAILGAAFSASARSRPTPNGAP